MKALIVAALAPYPALWAITLALVAVDAVWLLLTDITIARRGFLIAGAISAVLAAAAGFWTHGKSEPILRAMALSSATLLAFTAAAALLHYLAATLALPLVDPYLARADAALGFDWPDYTAFLTQHAAIELALAIVYHSSAPQMTMVVIVLSATLRLERLAVFVHLFAASLAAVIAISSFLPAIGPYAFYNAETAAGLRSVGGTWHLAPLSELRGGEAQTIALGDIRGLAAFPSFHVCLAFITAWALAPVRIVGPLAIATNAGVIVGTISAGGHYLLDVIAGAALAASLLACRNVFRSHPAHGRHPGEPRAAPSLRSRATSSAVMRAPS